MRRALAVVVCVAALLPLAGVQAAHVHGGRTGQAVLLRYRFVAGQDLTFAATTSTDVTLATLSTPLGMAESTQSVSEQVHQRVLSVAASGEATVALSVSSGLVTATVNGTMRTQTLPELSLGTVSIAPDGRETLRVRAGGLAIGGLYSAALPAGPVTVGAQWTTTQTATLGASLGSSTPLTMTLHNTLESLGVASGEPVAVISSTAPVQLAFSLTELGLRLHFHEAGLYTQLVEFGLSSGQPVSTESTLTGKLTVSATNALGQTRSVQGRLTEHSFSRRIAT